MKIVIPLLLLLLLTFAEPGLAIREGTATADLFITHYTESGDFGKLALWHDAAAECLTRISIPMNDIAHAYYTRHGHKKWAARAEKEKREIHRRYEYHRKHATIARKKSQTPETALKTEQRNIEKFILTWLPRYPNRFYQSGIYPTFLVHLRNHAEQKNDYATVLNLEADAAEMCAAQYELIPIAYGLKHYQKFRDVYHQHAAYLRQLAQQNPKTLPTEVDKGKQLINSLETETDALRQEADTICHIVKSDASVKTALATQTAVHAHTAFHGFAWIVTFSNHSHGPIVTVIVTETTSLPDKHAITPKSLLGGWREARGASPFLLLRFSSNIKCVEGEGETTPR